MYQRAQAFAEHHPRPAARLHWKAPGDTPLFRCIRERHCALESGKLWHLLGAFFLFSVDDLEVCWWTCTHIEINQASHVRTCCRDRAVRAPCRSVQHMFPYRKLTMFFDVVMNMFSFSVPPLFGIPRLLILITCVDVGVSLITPFKVGTEIARSSIKVPNVGRSLCIFR